MPIPASHIPGLAEMASVGALALMSTSARALARWLSVRETERSNRELIAKSPSDAARVMTAQAKAKARASRVRWLRGR
jgi:hypothetical protein